VRVSVPGKRRKRGFLISVLLVVALATATALGAASPVPVKATTSNEVKPSATTTWLAWAQSRPGAGAYDAWAQHGTDPPFKVNPTNKPAYPGGIDSDRLVYQQITGVNRADLRLYDLARRQQVPVPTGINTKSWECCATLSGNWLLFTRGYPKTRQLQLVILRNLVTGEQRILARLRSRKGILRAGQVSGGFAVWSKCNPSPSCAIFRYDLGRGVATPLSVPAGKAVYSPSVNANGTVYYLTNKRACGKSVELVKQLVGGGSEVLNAFPEGLDGAVTFALLIKPRPLRGPVTTRVYYGRVECRKHAWDVYRVDDIELPSPPPVYTRR
jgi:hypothetical protein